MSRVAIIGTGISGLVAAHQLYREHDLTLFEAQSHIGGHTLTSPIDWDGRRYAIDAGFIVFNEVNYPRLVELFDELGVASQPTSMSFSVRSERSGLEYSSRSLGGLFAQRGNLLRPRFWGLLRDILRFNRDSRELLARGAAESSLGETLERGRYSRAFIDEYLIPMGAAIWSTPPDRMLDFPAASFLRFLDNHGLLTVRGQPQWRSVVGGSFRYVERLTRPFADRIRLDTPVARVRRTPSAVRLTTRDGERLEFDQIVLATHSDQALKLLADPSPEEIEILGAIPYQRNEATLHTDVSLLPSRRNAWASWNYHVPASPRETVCLTYNMKMLQCLEPEAPTFCVSLNLDERIDESKVLRRFVFSHPQFGPDSTSAQRRRSEISGVRGTHYCGAYWGYGFHEDGVVSGLDVASDVQELAARSDTLPFPGPRAATTAPHRAMRGR